MKINKLQFSVLQKRLGAIGILGILGAASYLTVATLSSQLASIDQQIVDVAAERDRLEKILVQLRQSEAAGKQNDVQRFREDFLSGSDDSLMLAELQARLRALVINKSCELSSASVLPNKLAENQTFLGLRLQIMGSLANIQQVFHQIEYATPLLFIERVILRPTEESNGPQTPTVMVELDVYGAKWADLRALKAAHAEGGR